MTRYASPLKIGLAFILVVYMALASANQGCHPWVNEHAPQVYIVQDGDTLWEIACKFLSDPGRWQQIWFANENIQDPNRIYPGDILSLEYVDGQPRIRMERRRSCNQCRTQDPRTGVVKLHPGIKVSAADKPIPTIALSVIAPFFNPSRSIRACDALKSPIVVALDEDHIVVGERDRIYVSDLCPPDDNVVYTVVRPGKDYIEPCCHEKLLGIEGFVVGKAKLERLGDPSSMILSASYAEVRVGDRIIETLIEEVEPYFMPKYAQNQALGQIVSVFGGMTQIGQYSVVVLTGGGDMDREVGDVLTIYQTHSDIPHRLFYQRDEKLCFPPLNVGLCLVFRVFDKVSYALVMKATRPIYLLDNVARS
jgi:hypothetical protein